MLDSWRVVSPGDKLLVVGGPFKGQTVEFCFSNSMSVIHNRTGKKTCTVEVKSGVYEDIANYDLEIIG